MSSLIKNTSKIQIIDPSPFLSKHINEIKLNQEEDTFNRQNSQKNRIETNLTSVENNNKQNNNANNGVKQKFSFVNFSSQKKYFKDKYSKLPVKKKVRVLIVLGVCCSIIVILFILLILFATGIN
jgi:hypothetical protein